MKPPLVNRLVAEFLGTFAIVFFGCGAIITLKGESGAHFMVNVVFGLTVAASIYALGHISAAHFNPAVSVGFAMAKRFPWREVPSYIAAQAVGAVASTCLHAFLFGSVAKVAAFGSTIPASSVGTSLAIEVVMTFFLMLVIISVATDNRANPAISGIAIGMAVTLCGLFGGPISGCSMNPARSLGPAVFAQGASLSSYWIYVLAPMAGACVAARLYEWMRDSKPTTA